MSRKRCLAFALALSLCGSTLSAQTVRNLEVPVKVTDAAVNSFISHQWSEEGWDEFVGTIGVCYFEITVPPPSVTFIEDHASLTLAGNLTSSNCGGPWSFSVSPEIGIPSGQITTADVKMWLTDLLDLINGLGFPAWVKQALVDAFGPWADLNYIEGQIDLFPAALLTGIGGEWFDQRSINFDQTNPFEIGWRVEDGFVELLPSANVQAGISGTVAPQFNARLKDDDDDGPESISLWSNIEATVKKIRIFNIAGIQVYELDPDVKTIKSQGNEDDVIHFTLEGENLTPTGAFPTWILFEINETFYLRKYIIFPVVHPYFTLATDGYNGI